MPAVRRHAQGTLIQLQRRTLPEFAAVGGFVDLPSGRRVEKPAPAGHLHEDVFFSGVIAGGKAAARKGQMQLAIGCPAIPEDRAGFGVQGEEPALTLQKEQSAGREPKRRQRLRRLGIENDAHLIHGGAGITTGGRCGKVPEEFTIVAAKTGDALLTGGEKRVGPTSRPARCKRQPMLPANFPRGRKTAVESPIRRAGQQQFGITLLPAGQHPFITRQADVPGAEQGQRWYFV